MLDLLSHINDKVSTDFTSSNRIELSEFVQDLLYFK